MDRKWVKMKRRNRVSFIRLIRRKLRTTIGLQFMDFDLRRDIPGLRYILVKLLCLSSNVGIREKSQGGAVFQDLILLGIDEYCSDFLAYSEDHQYDWENAFLGWIGESKRRVEDRRLSQNHWGPWNLVKVQKSSVLSLIRCSVLCFPSAPPQKVSLLSLHLSACGPLACQLAQHAVVLKINDWIFCHGGLLPRHGCRKGASIGNFAVAYGIDVRILACKPDKTKAGGLLSRVDRRTSGVSDSICSCSSCSGAALEEDTGMQIRQDKSGSFTIERMNNEVSQGTRGLREDDDIHNFPSMPVPRN
ncbi:hypothetical protein POTOM_005744 [Populus tomentosa]|uniref:Uncharacterized protein n=1 Tax=Populus tomentosa TaxID=118781 RepID=A0A8X8DFV5_POPTO|nr:hypothetical protein POTOM_005744 [Populus tomentosa]